MSGGRNMFQIEIVEDESEGLRKGIHPISPGCDHLASAGFIPWTASERGARSKRRPLGPVRAFSLPYPQDNSSRSTCKSCLASRRHARYISLNLEPFTQRTSHLPP